MAGFGDDTRSDLTLCIFPHLREFVVVDARAGLPDRPRVCTLAVDEVLADNFYTEVEREFASLLKRGESPFLTLMSISQEVEGMVRARVHRSILSRVNSDVDREAGDGSAGVAVVFFTGPLLAMDRAQLHHAAAELFGDSLPADLVDTCVEQVSALVRAEKEADTTASRTDLPGLIRGEGSRYVTLWESGERD